MMISGSGTSLITLITDTANGFWYSQPPSELPLERLERDTAGSQEVAFRPANKISMAAVSSKMAIKTEMKKKS